MADYHLAVVPVGRLDRAEIENAASRAAKVLHQPLELRESLAVPRESEDRERGQHRAATLMKLLRAEVAKLKPGTLVGGDSPEAKTPLRPEAFVFVTDVDLFTANTEGVFAALLRANHCAVVSVRRLREAFYRRKADPNRQRARVVKEILRMWGRLRGAPECTDPNCVMAPSKSVPDLDTKEERFCRDCEQRLFEGKLLI